MKNWILLFAASWLLMDFGSVFSKASAAPLVQETPASEGQDEVNPAEPQEDPVLAEYLAISADYEQAMTDWQTRIREANIKTREEAEPYIKERATFVSQAVSKYAEFASKHPDHEKVFECQLFVAQNSTDADAKKTALQKLISDHSKNANFVRVLFLLAFGEPSQANVDGLRSISERAETPELKGQAQYFLGKTLFDAKANADAYLNDESVKSQLEPETISFLEKVKGIPEAEYVDILKKAAADYPEVDLMGEKLGEVIKKLLFEIEFLSLGKVAPEIEGEDIDGEAFKLSDYRGKVVMLDFWGDW